MMGMRAARGFSLLELLIAFAIFSLILVAAFGLYAVNNDTYARGQSSAESQQNARVALEAMARETRVAGYDPSGVIPTLTAPYPLQVAESSNLTFVADVDDDGVLDQVSYRQQGTQIVRDLATWTGASFASVSSGAVADGVGTLVLTYFDDTTPTNTELVAPVTGATLGAVRRVTIGLMTLETTQGRQVSYPLTVDVQVRN